MGHGRGSATNSSDGRLHSYRDADGRELLALGVAMAIQENGLIKREQSELAHSAEREDRRAKLNGTDFLDYFAMLRGWELAREGI